MGTKTGRMLDAKGNPIGDKAQAIVEKAVVGSVLSNVKTSVPGFLGKINNFGKVSFEEAVANANDAQKAVLDNMGVDYDTSLDVTAAEKADMARQEKEALEMATFLANERKADKARAEAAAAAKAAAAKAAAEQAARDNNNNDNDGGMGFDSDGGTADADSGADDAMGDGGNTTGADESDAIE
jgi:glucose-1-phosphatase